jgi:hypothetical protein
VEGVAGKIETPTQWNPIGRRLTALSPVLSPSIILRHLRFKFFHFRNRNFGGAFKKCYLNFLYFLKLKLSTAGVYFTPFTTNT